MLRWLGDTGVCRNKLGFGAPGADQHCCRAPASECQDADGFLAPSPWIPGSSFMKVQLSKANISACQGTLKAHKERFLSPGERQRSSAMARTAPALTALQRRAAERSYPHLGGALLRSVRVVPFRVGSASGLGLAWQQRLLCFVPTFRQSWAGFVLSAQRNIALTTTPAAAAAATTTTTTTTTPTTTHNPQPQTTTHKPQPTKHNPQTTN